MSSSTRHQLSSRFLKPNERTGSSHHCKQDSPLLMYKRRKLHGTSIALVPQVNATTESVVSGSSIKPHNNYLFSEEKKILDNPSKLNNEVGECLSSHADFGPFGKYTSGKEFCISVLKNHGLLGARSRHCSETKPFCDSIPLMLCGICDRSEEPLKMLICDICEEAFHLHCLSPKVKELPIDDEWYCKPCSENNAKRSINFNPISIMLKDVKQYTAEVRIGKNFQAEVPEWSGPSRIDRAYYGDPLKMDLTPCIYLNGLDRGKSTRPKSSIGNWVQCRDVIGTDENDEDIVCGKWRRAPFFEVQQERWDCSCGLFWDPFYADCAVPQELETGEVLRHLQYINLLKPRLEDKGMVTNQS